MRRKIVKFSLGLLVLLTVLVIGFVLGDIYEQNSTETAAHTSKVSQSLPTRAELLKLVNEQRAKAGVKPLVESPQLDASAQMKAQSEVDNNHFGHMLNGVFVGQKFMIATGIVCASGDENLTENIAGRNTAEQAVYSWTMSKPHYKAMINPKYTLTGFGVEQDEIVEHFCEQP